MPSPESMTEWRRKFKQRDDEFRAAVEHHASLDAALKQMELLANSGDTVSSEAIRAALTSARAGAAGLDSHLRNTGRPSLYTERCPDRARGLAQRVFDVPELLELILSKLPVLELLKCYRVNHQWRDAIESSVNLQRQLSLRADTLDGHFQNVFQGRICGYSEVLPGFGTRAFFSTHRALSSYEETLPGNEILFKAEFASTNDYFRMPKKIGARVRRMYICQPPVKELKVYLECCRYNFTHHSDDHDRHSATVTNENGLTIGDLLDKTIEMLEAHKFCANAEVFMLDDETGEVKNEVSFRGTVVLKDDDPMLIEKREKEETRKRELREKKLRRQYIEQYRTAARLARESNQPMPDLQEFIAEATKRELEAAS
ncbi:hypothetical protein CBER1_04603 [Cercospora berteroae]|uniref:F-box domain-containing protein n=1 Tax=Cercospora berteroae TaxID=357750 RepID=A0A2S6C2A9_9PEZI|nr:hypothetical protein CBER1_04603 [Cercospora berteroae]